MAENFIPRLAIDHSHHPLHQPVGLSLGDMGSESNSRVWDNRSCCRYVDILYVSYVMDVCRDLLVS